MSYAIGIDLGTTHSVVSIAHSQTEVNVLVIDGSPLVPSVIAYVDGTPLVGTKATTLPGGFSSFKRFMTNPAAFIRDDKSPIILSAELLRKLRSDAEIILKKPVTKAVITVPAYFDDTARQATKDAASLAGIEVLRLLNEPTAAALAYGLDQQALKQQTEGIYAIYDLGGGTFDISLLKMTRGVFQVLATGGDVHLGGDDIDDAIVNHWKKTGTHYTKMARTAKEALSTNDSWSYEDVQLTRVELELLSKPIIEKTIVVVEGVLNDAKLSVEAIQGVVLVGGATRMPLVQSLVSTIFKQTPLTNLDPDQVVSRGAALQAFMLTQGQGTLLLDVTPLSLGIETMGGLVEKLIPRNTAIPTCVSQEFTTYENNQTALKCHIVQGERELVADCRSLAQFTLEGIPPMPAGVARISVTFQLDADGLLSVEAFESTTQKKQTIMVKPSYGLSEEELRCMLCQSQMHGLEDMQKRLLIEAKVDAERLLRYCQSAIEVDGHLLNEDELASIVIILSTMENVLQTDNKELIREQSEALKQATSVFAAIRMNHAIQKKLIGNKI
ncbi:MAG: Fe-S protein assembly chaperone HscA [Pseudomonadota bacterium]